MVRLILLLGALAGCDLLDPRVSDVPIDAPAVDASPDAGFVHILPAGTAVPGVDESPELVSQIQIFDGLSDNALAAANGIVTRSTGKANGGTVRFWNFGPTLVVDGIIASALLYVLVDDDGAGTLTPRADHPWLIDSIPGDVRYSAIRRVIYVPVTASYAGERLTTVEALSEAIAVGIVGEPVPAGVWRNLPVVPPGTRLELGTSTPPQDVTEVYGRGHRIGVFPIGVPQPFRNNQIPLGNEARLVSGVETGSPPVVSTQLDAQPVFQYGVPAAPPTTAYNYTPVVLELDVQLADGIAPSTIAADGDLFTRAGNGSITGIYVDNVASYVTTTTYSNKQIQFADGAP